MSHTLRSLARTTPKTRAEIRALCAAGASQRELMTFVDEQQVNQCGYSTSSEYVRELIRKDQDRLRLRNLLLADAASKPGVPVDGGYFESLRAKVRNGQWMKKPKSVIPGTLAQQDVDEALNDYLSEGAARGVIDPLKAAYAHIGQHSAAGSLRYAHAFDLPGLRSWSLKRYPYIVFYLERDNHIDIWRVLHSERDIPAWCGKNAETKSDQTRNCGRTGHQKRGATGYLDFHGNMDLAIAIRTGVIRDKTLSVQAGAGIVADSDPEAEWEETRNKARALLLAELAEAGLDTKQE